jgi:Ca-activated chloride channel family protein
MKHIRRIATAALVAVCLVQTPRLLHAQERPTFSAGVALVPITAVVRDARSRIVRDLARDDFQVLENSQPRPILDFRSTDHGPVSIAVLFDTSGSMRGSNLSKGKAALDRLLSSLDQTADEVSLFTFDNTVRQETPFTKDAAQIRAALTHSDGWGLTSIYDAVAETAKRLADRRADRRAVVVITDGVDTSSMLTPAEVSSVASGIDVPIYVLAVQPARHEDVRADPNATDLSDLAHWTGGELRHADSVEQSERAIAALVAELRQQYFLAIEASAASGWNRIDVVTKRRDLTVRSRSGYFATTTNAPGAGQN